MSIDEGPDCSGSADTLAVKLLRGSGNFVRRPVIFASLVLTLCVSDLTLPYARNEPFALTFCQDLSGFRRLIMLHNGQNRSAGLRAWMSFSA
jgi:hypothetical protein